MNKKKLLILLLNILGINALFRFLNRRKAIILWYHGVCDDDFQLLKGYDERHLQKSIFQKQLKYLKRKGYIFVTMSELVNALKMKEDIRKYIVLTFDDGFQNVIKNAYPIMKEANAKGCFYLVSGLIGENELLWTDYVETVVRNCKEDEIQFAYKGKTGSYSLNGKRSMEYAMQDIKNKLRVISDQERKEHLLQLANTNMDEVPEEFSFSNWEQIRDLDKNILEVGSHTVNHPNCANLVSDNELEHELKDSRLEIELKVGYSVRHFCYPAGSYNDDVVKNLKRYDYDSATTIHSGFNDTNTDLFQLKRILACGDMWLFKSMISGSYYFISAVIRRFKGTK